MDMSSAALPPRSGQYTKRDEAHPLFNVYRQYQASRRNLMIDCEDFRDWLSCYEREQMSDHYAKHPRFSEFQQWMRDEQAGRRKCLPTRDLPNGLCFPANFIYWIDGGRW